MDPNDYRPAIITNWMKTLMTFIDRVGFPVLAFLLMWYHTIQLTHTIEDLHQTIIEIKQLLLLRGIH